MDSFGIKKRKQCLSSDGQKQGTQSKSVQAVRCRLDLQPESSKRHLLNEDVWRQILVVTGKR